MNFSSVIRELRLISWIVNQFKGYNLCTIQASLTKLDVHQCVIVIYIYFKFQEIPSNGYLLMAPDERKDGKTDERTDGRTWRKQYPSPFGGRKIWHIQSTK